VVDFGVERHTLVTGEIITDLPSIFSSSYTGCSSKGALIQGEGATSEET
jgi:hypothetical protein